MAGNRRIWDLNGNGHFDPGEKLFWYNVLQNSAKNASSSESGSYRRAARPKREEKEAPEIVIPSRPTKEQYRSIKKYLWVCIRVDLFLILFFMALPAGALIYATIAVAVDDASAPAVTIMVIIVSFAVYVFCTVSAPFFKEIDKNANDLKLLKKNYRAVKKEEKNSKDPFFMYHP